MFWLEPRLVLTSRLYRCSVIKSDLNKAHKVPRAQYLSISAINENTALFCQILMS